MAILRNLTNPAPPSLPLAPEQYERRYQDQYSNVFRLYFNQLSNALQALFGPNGGQYIDCPNALFFNTVDQTFPLANTAYPIVFNQPISVMRLHWCRAVPRGSLSVPPGCITFSSRRNC
jgi:hypothetical protein